MTQNFQRLNPPLGPRTACGAFGPPPDRLQPLWDGCGTSGLPPVPQGRLLSLRATSSTSRPLLAPPGRLPLLQGISRPSGSPTAPVDRCDTSGLPSAPPGHLWHLGQPVALLDHPRPLRATYSPFGLLLAPQGQLRPLRATFGTSGPPAAPLDHIRPLRATSRPLARLRHIWAASGSFGPPPGRL